ncbi:MAG: hypothetical protein P8Z41_14930, partial [Anaerolineales bacterium]
RPDDTLTFTICATIRVNADLNLNAPRVLTLFKIIKPGRPHIDIGAELEAKLLQALAERDRHPAMRKAARELAEARANWKQNFLKLLDAYELARSFARQGAEGKHARVR